MGNFCCCVLLVVCVVDLQVGALGDCVGDYLVVSLANLLVRGMCWVLVYDCWFGLFTWSGFSWLVRF